MAYPDMDTIYVDEDSVYAFAGDSTRIFFDTLGEAHSITGLAKVVVIA